MAKSQSLNLKSPGFRSAAGFSMVEVLVASTILVVIVMMLGMLFQQTSLAWRTGTRRAESFMQVRSGIGAIQRDASAAVDARFLPPQYVTEEQNFSGGSLLFYTLSGGVELRSAGTPLYNRSLKKVTYDKAGNRVETPLEGSGNWGTPKRSNVLTFAERQGSKNRPNASLTDFHADYGKAVDNLDPGGLPLAVTFGARVTTTGNSLDIGAWSYGPDRTPNTKDDIKTWVEE